MLAATDEGRGSECRQLLLKGKGRGNECWQLLMEGDQGFADVIKFDK